MARLLWRLWSPNWQFAEATFDATASSFDNPDFVPVSFNPIVTAMAILLVTQSTKVWNGD